MNRPVLIIVPSLNTGGAERIAIELANWLIEHEVTVNVMNLTGLETLKHRLHPTIPYQELDFRRVRNSFFYLRKVLARGPQMSVISFMTHTNIVILLANICLRNTGHRMFVVEVGHKDTWMNKRKTTDVAMSLLIRYLFRAPTQVICVSESIRGEIQKYAPSLKPSVIRNPLNLEEVRRLSGLDNDGILNHWSTLPRRLEEFRQIRLCGVGRLEEIKRFDILIRVCSLLRDWGVRCSLDLVGAGQQEDYLRSLAKELCLTSSEVNFHGFTNNPWSIMALADVVVAPSQSEGASLVAVEALAVGARVVGSNTGGIPETLCFGQVGTLVLEQTAQVYARSILQEARTERSYDLVEKHLLSYERSFVGRQFFDHLKETDEQSKI